MSKRNDLETQIEFLEFGPAYNGQSQETFRTWELPTRNTLVKFEPDVQIDIFCKRYKEWVLRYVKELALRPYTGYPVLAILNSYFDMIAQLSGYYGDDEHGKAIKPSKRVKKGLKMVFEELETEPEITDELVEYLRNHMAHMGMTKEAIILEDKYDEPLVWGDYYGKRAIVINPRLWAERLCEHFDQFYAELRDPKNEHKRQSFLARVASEK